MVLRETVDVVPSLDHPSGFRLVVPIVVQVAKVKEVMRSLWQSARLLVKVGT